MKNYYILVTIEENGKKYAYCLKVNEHENLFSALRIPNAISANIYPTKRFCHSVAESLNRLYRQQGLYLYDTPAF